MYQYFSVNLLLLQGALVASAMIIIQHTETMAKNSKVMEIRKKYAKLISDRLEDTVAKFGAILAQGIVDAGIYILVNYSLIVAIDMKCMYIL